MKVVFYLTIVVMLAAAFDSLGANNPVAHITPLPQQLVAATASEYMSALYRWLLGVVAISSLFALVYGGVLYIFSGAISTTAEAKKWITNALLGLLIAAASWVILNTINPDLVKKFDIEGIINKHAPPTKGGGGGGGGGGYVYQWASLPNAKSCVDVLGADWEDTVDSNCHLKFGPKPAGSTNCCKKLTK